MSLSVRRWTQRRLLYPLAIFAIIAPTVVMALFGTYALRDTVLRPTSYRKQLADARAKVSELIESRLSELEQSTVPPASTEDLVRARADTETYFLRYTASVASRAFVGIGGSVEPGVGVDGSRNISPPPELRESLAAIRGGGADVIAREKISLDALVEGRIVHRAYVVFTNRQSGGFVAWELLQNELVRITDATLKSLDSEGDAVSMELVERSTFRWELSPAADSELLGFAPAHDAFLTDQYLVLRLDTKRQFTQDETLLSSIYILIAVLCVPIVASATLMVVHMILREASEARKKVDFVSNVTHELKTPLTSIRMFVETLKLGRVKDPEKVQACLDTIMNETQRLGGLIDHVLSFSKVENQVKKYNVQPGDLAQVVIDTINFFKGQAPRPRDRVQRRILAGVPTTADFDKDAIREVLLNLLSNAVKYSPGEKPIVVTVGANDKELFLAVQDQGIGIDTEHHERIFEKFFRVDEELTRNVDGTGLGLAIVAEIVKAHGGRITVDSALGRGSTFTVYLPWRHSGSTVIRRKTTRRMAGDMTISESLEPVPEAKKTSDRQPANARLILIPAMLALAGSMAIAQPELEGDEPAEEKKPESSLQPRPESDPETEAWIRKLGGLRPRAVAVEPGVIVGHVLNPEGDRLYYFRPVKPPVEPPKPAPGQPSPPPPPARFGLYTAGPDKPETRLMDTGASCEPPLFLPEGRMLVVQRRVDTNDDGEINAMDEASLMMCNREGESARTVATLQPDESPVATWRAGAEVLISKPGADNPNGWIFSINLARGIREKVVEAFTVSLVLPGDKLVIERLVAPPAAAQNPRMNPFGQPAETASEQPLPTLADPPEHLVYDPADGSVSPLYAGSAHSRIVCQGGGAYFGHTYSRADNMAPTYGRPVSAPVSEILIIDDAQHRDTRSQTSRHDHFALAWVQDRGLIVLQPANLRSRIMLFDRALKWHTLGELDLAVRGVRAAGGGLRLAWLEVEDTDENGLLEPWKDHSRPFFCTIE